MRGAKALSLIAMLAAIVLGGTVSFRLVEGWSWLDSYFSTVVTLSTVGYGSLVPATAAGKIGTTLFIFLGLGVFVAAVQQFGSYAVKKRDEHTEWLIGRLGHHPGNPEEDPEAANNPDRPPE